MLDAEIDSSNAAFIVRAVNAHDDLVAALIDCHAMLEHYASGKPHNWDGSTKTQAKVAMREAIAALAKAKE